MTPHTLCEAITLITSREVNVESRPQNVLDWAVVV
jgi:hypothetical protein